MADPNEHSAAEHPSRRNVTAAVVQAAPVGFHREATLVKAIDLATRARSRGADLVVFPEAFLSAYPRGLDLGAVVGWRSEAGRDVFLCYWDSAVDVPGPVTDRLAEASCELALDIVIGVIERGGSTLYCSVLFFSPEEGLYAKHRKVMPTGSERLIWGFGDGSTLKVHRSRYGNLGAAICWENYMPLLRYALYRQDVQIWCAPTADARDSWTASMRHIAVEGRCYVLSANQYTTRADYPADYTSAFGDDPDQVVTRGGSCIVDPFGEVLGRSPLWQREDPGRRHRSYEYHQREVRSRRRRPLQPLRPLLVPIHPAPLTEGSHSPARYHRAPIAVGIGRRWGHHPASGGQMFLPEIGLGDPDE